MGSLVSGITKLFTSIGSGIAAGAATLGNAVRAVGSTLFTGMAATGTGMAGASASGPLANLLGGGSTLSNILGGALKQGLATGLVGGVVGAATGQGFGTGFKQGAMTGAIMGGFSGAFTPTGMGSATGTDMGVDMAGNSSSDMLFGASGDNLLTGNAGASTSPYAGAGVFPPAPNAPVAPTLGAGSATGGTGGQTGGLGDFFKSEGFAGMMGGIGEQMISERQIEALMESRELDREFLREQQQRKTDSYDVDASAMLGTPPPVQPASTAAGRRSARADASTPKWKYNPGSGMIEMA